MSITNRPLRIAFTGSSGTGKSVLAEWVAETFALPLNPVGARSVAKEMGFDSPYDVDAAGVRGEFQRRLTTSKVAWEKGRERFVTDRTTFDNLVYTMLHDVTSIDRDLLALVDEGMARYHLVFFLPVDSFLHLGEDEARIGGGKHTAADPRVYHELYEQVLRAMANFTQRARLWKVRESELAERQRTVGDRVESFLSHPRIMLP